MNNRDDPMPVIREELGGDYYYRCGWLSCYKVVKREWEWCPYCGSKLDFDIGYNKQFRYVFKERRGHE